MHLPSGRVAGLGGCVADHQAGDVEEMTALRKFNAKRDANEPEVVRAFIDLGCLVFRLDRPVDLLVYCFKSLGQRLHLIEVKVPKGELNDKQKLFVADGWPVHVIRSADEAIAFVKSIREAA